MHRVICAAACVQVKALQAGQEAQRRINAKAAEREAQAKARRQKQEAAKGKVGSLFPARGCHQTVWYRARQMVQAPRTARMSTCC